MATSFEEWGRQYNLLQSEQYFGSVYGRTGLQAEASGFADLASLNASKFIGGRAAQDSRSDLLGTFRDETTAYETLMNQQAQNSSEFAANLSASNARLAGVRAGAASAPSKASSVRQFQQLAKQSLQGTSRYLSELEGYKLPEAPQIDFTFKNPITGEDIEYGTKFEDIYDGGFDPRSEARRTILNEFQTIKDRELSTFSQQVLDEYGAEESYYQPYEDMRNEDGYIVLSVNQGTTAAAGTTWRAFTDAQEAFKADNESWEVPVWRNENQLNAWEQEQLRKSDYRANYERMIEMNASGESYAEARAIAEMGGIDDVTYNDAGRTGQGTTEGSIFFRDADINQILEDMTDATTQRLETARLTEQTDFRQEFEARSDRAAQQQALFDTQLQSNQAQKQQIAEEKQRVQQLLEQQKREYAEALSGFGSSSADGQSGITFSDIRPM